MWLPPDFPLSSLLAPFWLPSAPSWLPLGSLLALLWRPRGPPLAPSWLSLGRLLAPIVAHPFGSLL
eukprot:9444847-Pyramimonas_sp.AAC.1